MQLVTDALSSISHSECISVKTLPRPLQMIKIISKLRVQSLNSSLGCAGDIETLCTRQEKQIWEAYEARLAQAGALDFELLLLRTIQLLENFPQVLSRR